MRRWISLRIQGYVGPRPEGNLSWNVGQGGHNKRNLLGLWWKFYFDIIIIQKRRGFPQTATQGTRHLRRIPDSAWACKIVEKKGHAQELHNMIFKHNKLANEL